MLRKIIRRSITHGRLLGQTKPFLYEMVFAVRDLMVDAYPELKESADRVSKAVLAEETRFANTLNVGLEKLEEILKSSDGALAGDDAFRLYDTFGMPLDFMQDAARDRGLGFDQAGFDRAMAEQRERARASWKRAPKQAASPIYHAAPGKARPSKPPIPRISSFRNRSLKGIDRRVRITAKSSPSSKADTVRRNYSPVIKGRSFSTTLRSTPNLAGRLAIVDGFIPTITIPLSPK